MNLPPISALGTCLDTTYATVTTSAAIQACCDLASVDMFLVAAFQDNAQTNFHLGAYVSKADMCTQTARNTPRLSSSGSWFYWTPGKSFGFSPTSTINQINADFGTPGNRLSWHLDGQGGYRAGDVLSLTNDATWRKRIYTYSVNLCIPPTAAPSLAPTAAPSTAPTAAPSMAPSVAPSMAPSMAPTSFLSSPKKKATKLKVKVIVKVKVKSATKVKVNKTNAKTKNNPKL